MAFNFEDIINQANAALQGGDSTYKYRLVYPNIGTTSIKLLFNQQSNSIMRLVNRHKIGDTQVPCLKTYGQKCPICDALTNIENARGVDLYKMSSKVRGITIAQFVGSDYKIENVNVGDLILFMFPWTVYKQLSQIIDQSKNDLERLIATNEGFVVNITRDSGNQYNTQVSPFKTYKSCASDADFMNMLNGIDNLNDQILPNAPTDEIIKNVNQTANELTQQYLVSDEPRYVNNPSNQQSTNLSGFGQQSSYQQSQQVPVAPAPQPQQINPQPVQNNQSIQQPVQQGYNYSAPQPNPVPTQRPVQTVQNQAPISQNNFMNPPVSAPTNNGNVPECFGRHGQVDQNQCLLCPQEIQCTQATK